MLPNSFYQRFAVYAPNGSIDIKKSVKQFEEAFAAWMQEQSDLKPAILAELKDYGRLGEARLTQFVLHRLRLQPNKENQDRIANALQELDRAGKIVRRTTESGSARGRGTGWEVVKEEQRSSGSTASS